MDVFIQYVLHAHHGTGTGDTTKDRTESLSLYPPEGIPTMKPMLAVQWAKHH